MDNDPPARAGRKKEEDGRRMRMKRGEGWVMPMMIGEWSVLRLKMMVVVGNPKSWRFKIFPIWK